MAPQISRWAAIFRPRARDEPIPRTWLTTWSEHSANRASSKLAGEHDVIVVEPPSDELHPRRNDPRCCGGIRAGHARAIARLAKRGDAARWCLGERHSASSGR